MTTTPSPTKKTRVRLPLNAIFQQKHGSQSLCNAQPPPPPPPCCIRRCFCCPVAQHAARNHLLHRDVIAGARCSSSFGQLLQVVSSVSQRKPPSHLILFRSAAVLAARMATLRQPSTHLQIHNPKTNPFSFLSLRLHRAVFSIKPLPPPLEPPDVLNSADDDVQLQAAVVRSICRLPSGVPCIVSFIFFPCILFHLYFSLEFFFVLFCLRGGVAGNYLCCRYCRCCN